MCRYRAIPIAAKPEKKASLSSFFLCSLSPWLNFNLAENRDSLWLPQPLEYLVKEMEK